MYKERSRIKPEIKQKPYTSLKTLEQVLKSE